MSAEIVIIAFCPDEGISPSSYMIISDYDHNIHLCMNVSLY